MHAHAHARNPEIHILCLYVIVNRHYWARPSFPRAASATAGTPFLQRVNSVRQKIRR